MYFFNWLEQHFVMYEVLSYGKIILPERKFSQVFHLLLCGNNVGVALSVYWRGNEGEQIFFSLWDKPEVPNCWGLLPSWGTPTFELKHWVEHELKSSTGIINGDLCCQHWWWTEVCSRKVKDSWAGVVGRTKASVII